MTETELFFERTKRLASVLRLSQRELAIKIGVSAGSFFGYRTGRNRITNKAWAKLEKAERAAGIVSGCSGAETPAAGIVVRSGNPNDVGEGGVEKSGEVAAGGDHFADAGEMMAVLRESGGDYRAGGDQFRDAAEMMAVLRGQLAEKDRQIERLLGIVERQAAALERDGGDGVQTGGRIVIAGGDGTG